MAFAPLLSNIPEARVELNTMLGVTSLIAGTMLAHYLSLFAAFFSAAHVSMLAG